MGTMEEYKKSHIEIKLTFDKVREQDFKMILNEQFKIKAKLSKYFDDSANKQDQLERDFGNRETELQVFRRLSQNAINAPLLTKAMVKKVRKCIDSFDESEEKELTPYQKFRSIARVVFIFIQLSTRWRRYDLDVVSRNARYSSAGSTAEWYYKNDIGKKESTEKKEERKKKSKGNQRISDELQCTLRKSPELRSNEDIVKVQRFCRKLGALINFPVERETDVARVIGYECYERGRILSLQGRLPTRFYYILRGKVNKVKTIELTEGIKKQYFGELLQGHTTNPNEIQTRKARDCSLVAKSFVEVLVIEKEDFLDLLHTTTGAENCTIEFLRSIPLFQTYPLECLRQDLLTTKYFPKDTVIMKNIEESPCFYILKSGTCKLLQKYSVDAEGIPMTRRSFLPRIRKSSFAFSTTTIDSNDGPQTLNEARELHNDLSVFLEGPKKLEEDLTRQKTVNIEVHEKNIHLTVTQAKLPSPKPKKRKNKKPIPTLGELVYGTNETDRIRDSRIENMSPKADADSKLPFITVNHANTQLDVYTKSKDDKMALPGSASTSMGKNPGKEAYFQVGNFKVGDIYGLETIIKKAARMIKSPIAIQEMFTSHSSLEIAVVSEGTECILIDKKAFLETADFFTLSKIVAMTQTNSHAEDAQLQVEKVKDWGRYKKKLVGDILQRAKTKKRVTAYR